MKVGFGVPERLRNKKTGAATELVYDFIKFWSSFAILANLQTISLFQAQPVSFYRSLFLSVGQFFSRKNLDNLGS